MRKLCKGTVKVCKYVEDYIKDGDRSYAPDFELRTITCGFIRSNISDEYKNQILIKINDNKYFWINGRSILNTVPTNEKTTFVDEDSVVSLNNNQNEKKLGKSLTRN